MKLNVIRRGVTSGLFFLRIHSATENTYNTYHVTRLVGLSKNKRHARIIVLRKNDADE